MAANKKYEVMFSIAGKVAASFNGAFKGANKALTDANKRTKDLKASMEGLQGLASKGLAIGGAGLAGLGVMAKEAMNAESAFADFKKVFDGTDEDLAKFNKEFMRISSATGKTYEDVTLIASAAAQAGIAQKEIVKFSESAIQMGVAFDMTAEEAGQSMAELRVQFGLSQDAVNSFGDQLNYLGNTTPNTSKKLLEVTQRVGSLAKLANLTESDIAALGASVVGMEPEVMATGIKGVIYALSAGEGATKSQRAAFESLGLTAENVNKAMQKDSKKTMLAVLQAVKSLPKEEQANVLTSLFGKEGVGVTSQLVDNLDDVRKNIDAISEGNKKVWAGAMLKEYESRMKTTELAMARAKQSWRNIGITIGSIFLPAIAKASKKMSELAERVAKWVEANPELTAQLVKWGTIIAGVIAGVSALALGLVTFIGPIVMVAKSIGGIVLVFGKLFSTLRYLSTAIPWIITIVKWLASGLWLKAIALIKMLGTTFMWLGRVFLMNPIGLAITAIILVIWALWANWDTVCKYVGMAWEWLKGKWASGVQAVKQYFSQLGTDIKTNFNAVMDWFSNLPSRFVEFGRNLLQGLANGIRSGVSAAVNAAGEAVEAVKNKVKNFFGINSPSKLFAQYGEWNMEGLAIGMQTAAPIAERASQSAIAPVLPQASGQPLTNNARGSSSITVTVSQTITGGENVAEQAKTGVMDAVKQMQAHQNRNNRLSFA